MMDKLLWIGFLPTKQTKLVVLGSNMSVFGGKHITAIGFNRKTDGFSYKADWSGKHEFGQSSSPIKVYEFGFTSFFELCF